MRNGKQLVDKLRERDRRSGCAGDLAPDPYPPDQLGDACEGPPPCGEEGGYQGMPQGPAQDIRAPAWPEPPAEVALPGLAGEVVQAIDPATESDSVAILIQFLQAFGNAAGRSAYYQVEARRHYPNLYVVLVGQTAKGRKGTAWGWIEALFAENVAPGWGQRVQTGLSSGEGLIWAVHDEIKKKEPVKEKGRVTGYQDIVIDEGVADKRLFVVEEEFAQVLRQARRDGNILSAVVRQAWDSGRLCNMTKNSPAQATGAHVSILGHITQPELLKSLSETDTANGFANRFLWVCVRRSKLLPDGGEAVNLTALQAKVADALEFAKTVGRMQRDPDAAQLWRDRYPQLSRERPGMLGLVTNRAEAQVLRLSMVYALLDCSAVIRRSHLEAALALWDYVEASCRWIFGASTGNRDADRLLEALHAAGSKGLSRTEMSAVFGRNKSAAQIDQLLALLLDHGLVVPGKPAAGGKPAENWKAADLPPDAQTADHTAEAGEVVRYYQKAVQPHQDTTGAEQAVLALLGAGYTLDQLQRAADGYAHWCQRVDKEGRFRLAAKTFYADGGDFKQHLAGPPDYATMTPKEILDEVADLAPEKRGMILQSLPDEKLQAVHAFRRENGGNWGRKKGKPVGTATNPTKPTNAPAGSGHLS